MASIPVLVFKDGWKATASHNADAAGDGLTLTGWNAGGPQQADTWFQIDLGRPLAARGDRVRPVRGHRRPGVAGRVDPLL